MCVFLPVLWSTTGHLTRASPRSLHQHKFFKGFIDFNIKHVQSVLCQALASFTSSAHLNVSLVNNK